MNEETFRFSVADHVTSAVWTPAQGEPRALLVLGHGIANDREHFVLRGTLQKMAEIGVAGVRFNFPFKEEARTDLDSAEVQFATFRAAVQAGRERLDETVPLVIGGKSLSARIAAALQAQEEIAGALVYLGFPLHRADSVERLKDRHLRKVTVPQLFISGDRDPLCRLDLLRGVLEGLSSPWRLETIEGADHSLSVTQSGDDPVSVETVERICHWIDGFFREVVGL